jgi:predicted peptidase
MGGFGTWEAIQRRPGFFAAAIPVCGGGDTAQAPKLTKMPIWVWHGDSDRAVRTSHSRDMVAAIRKAGGKCLYTEVPNCGHGVWPRVYGSAQVWDWLFAQRLGKPETPPEGDLPRQTTRQGDPRPGEK